MEQSSSEKISTYSYMQSWEDTSDRRQAIAVGDAGKAQTRLQYNASSG